MMTLVFVCVLLFSSAKGFLSLLTGSTVFMYGFLCVVFSCTDIIISVLNLGHHLCNWFLVGLVRVICVFVGALSVCHYYYWVLVGMLCLFLFRLLLVSLWLECIVHCLFLDYTFIAMLRVGEFLGCMNNILSSYICLVVFSWQWHDDIGFCLCAAFFIGWRIFVSTFK